MSWALDNANIFLLFNLFLSLGLTEVIFVLANIWMILVDVTWIFKKKTFSIFNLPIYFAKVY